MDPTVYKSMTSVEQQVSRVSASASHTQSQNDNRPSRSDPNKDRIVDNAAATFGLEHDPSHLEFTDRIDADDVVAMSGGDPGGAHNWSDGWKVDGPSAVADGSGYGFKNWHNVTEQQSLMAETGAGNVKANDNTRGEMAINRDSTSAYNVHVGSFGTHNPIGGSLVGFDWPENDEKWPEPTNKA